jgi:hypothetical protein
MKRSMLIALSLLVVASMAFAQDPGSVMIFSDAGYSDCNIVDAGPALTPVYLVHMYSPGATASQFALDPGACNSMVFTGATNAFPTTIGDVFVGISVAYGSCLSGGPILLVTVNYFAQGLTGDCCRMQIVPDATPGAEETDIIVVDCASTKWVATGGTAIINSTPDCFCDSPVSESTWGGIKALYQ